MKNLQSGKYTLSMKSGGLYLTLDSNCSFVLNAYQLEKLNWFKKLKKETHQVQDAK